MRQVILNEDLHEQEVHVPGLYEKLQEVSVQSAAELLKDKSQLRRCDCPACASAEAEPAFEKYGYSYQKCRNCWTLYVSPRPTASQMDWYLMDSPAAKFRRSKEYLEPTERRHRERCAYNAAWVSSLRFQTRTDPALPVIDVESRNSYFFSEALRLKLQPLVCARPLAEINVPGVDTAASLRDLNGRRASVVSMFDVLERQAEPLDLLTAARDALDKDGFLALTTRSGSGFDIQVLWDRCATIYPVEHLNLVSLEGMRSLLQRAGFHVLETSTPGQLDVQLVERVMKEQPDAQVPRFLRYLLTHRDRDAKQRLQNLLQENLLSSHLRVVARKPTKLTTENTEKHGTATDSEFSRR